MHMQISIYRNHVGSLDCLVPEKEHQQIHVSQNSTLTTLHKHEKRINDLTASLRKRSLSLE